jgi:hypothetical protein
MLDNALSRRVGKGASSRRAHHFNDRTALREWWARHRLARSRDPLALPTLRFFTPSETSPHERTDMRVMPERTPISLHSSGLRLLISAREPYDTCVNTRIACIFPATKLG